MQFRFVLMLVAALLGPSLARLEAASSGKSAKGKSGSVSTPISYDKQIRPLLDKYCYSCHGNGKTKGDITLDGYKSDTSAVTGPRTLGSAGRIL